MENTTDKAFETANPDLQRLHREADDIQAYMSIPCNLQDPATLTDRLRDLDVYMARLSDMMLRAKALRDRAQYDYIDKNEDKLNKLTATVSNRMIGKHLFDYSMTYSRLETMYDTLKTLSRNLVTQISYIKEQMRNFN